MANKNQQAKTLSEAFLKVRDYLWDGRGKYSDVYPRKEMCICLAASLAKKANVITLEQRERICDTVMSRIYPHAVVRQYVHKELKVVKFNSKELQDYRHAWLIHLAQEFEDKNETI